MFNISLSKYTKYQDTPKSNLHNISMKQRQHLNISYVAFNTNMIKNHNCYIDVNRRDAPPKQKHL